MFASKFSKSVLAASITLGSLLANSGNIAEAQTPAATQVVARKQVAMTMYVYGPNLPLLRIAVEEAMEDGCVPIGPPQFCGFVPELGGPGFIQYVRTCRY